MASPPTGRCCDGFGRMPEPSAHRVDPPPLPIHTCSMRVLLALLCVWPAVGVSVARGQTDYYARLGVTLATDLVTDHIVQDIQTQQSLAPTLAFGVSLPIAPAYSAGLETALSTSGYHSNEADQKTDLGNLAPGSVLLNLEGPIRHRASWR